MKLSAAAALVLAAVSWQAPALAEITLAEKDGWTVSTDGRVNAFISYARGDGIPEGQTDFPGTATKDTKDSQNNLRSTRIRNGFLASILAFSVKKQVFKDLKVSAKTALWVNIAGSRTKNTPGAVDPREVYGKLEGSWGSVLGGSALGLFGRGGILVDSEIAHDFGLGYPCLIENASGGACGMAAFGAVFPSFEPGFVYTTPPSLGGFELSLGIYDPATVANAELNRAPLPRLEAEVAFAVPKLLKVFANGYWQTLEGSPAVAGKLEDRSATAWGGQAGFILTAGPVMVGGAGFMGQAFSPITYIEETVVPFDSQGIPRKARGGFGLGAFTFEAINLKVAGGAGLFHLDKAPSDPGPITAGMASNPRLLKQNFGVTAGLYQTTGPVRFALEYFRAEHKQYEYGEADPADATLIRIKKPVQVVNFINAGFTILW